MKNVDTSLFPETLTAESVRDFRADIGGSTRPHHGRIDGREYVLKCGEYSTDSSDEHVHNEYVADSLLRAAGCWVPMSKEYCADIGFGRKNLLRLSEFIPRGRTLTIAFESANAEERKFLIQQIVETYSAIAFIDGTDTYQHQILDNVLVDEKFHLWFVDNGAAFDFRARGKRKNWFWQRTDAEDPEHGYYAILDHADPELKKILASVSRKELKASAAKVDFVGLIEALPEDYRRPALYAYARSLEAWAKENTAAKKSVAKVRAAAVKIRVVKDDVAATVADAVVNAANEHLRAGSGICGAIFRRAGLAQLQAACDKVAPCPTGEARVTPAFGITNAKFIIHAVGPRYVDGRHGEPEKLASCYRNLLSAAVENGCKSVAVPSISTGIFGYPLKDAAAIAIHETKAFLVDHPELEVIFVAWDDETKELYERLLSK